LENGKSLETIMKNRKAVGLAKRTNGMELPLPIVREPID